MSKPKPTRGMRHVALFVDKLDDCVHFYTELLGMEIEWQPDPDNVYLCGGNDNLALHRGKPGGDETLQRLDHIGFILANMEDVDEWFEFLQQHDVKIKNPPRTHRDGARSFYCYDPGGVTVQMIYHPPISDKC